MARSTDPWIEARVAEVGVGGQAVELSFLNDLTPVEVVAVFLRDLADLVGDNEFLYDIAEQLDPTDRDEDANAENTSARKDTP